MGNAHAEPTMDLEGRAEMTPYYRRRWYRRRRRYYSRNTSRQTAQPTSPHEKSLQFVRDEFFALDSFSFAQFSEFYGNNYGDGPKHYMRRTYPNWKAGTTKMAGQTEYRILECVPPFLSTDKQFELLSFQVPSVIQQQKSKLNVSSIKTSDLENCYRSLAASVEEHEYKLDWFLKEVFPKEELSEFLKVFKYTMLDCLRQSYTQVRQDLMLIHEHLPDLEGSVDISYQASLLGCDVEVDVYPPPGSAQLTISMSEPSLVTQFRDQYMAILVDHSLSQCKSDAAGKVNQAVALSDVESVVAQLQRTTSDQEYDTTMDIQGQGGILYIHLQKKNMLRLRYAIAKQTMKLVLAVAVSGVVVAFLSINEWWPVLFYTCFIPFTIIGAIWRRLQELKSEVTEYEQKRAARLTAS